TGAEIAARQEALEEKGAPTRYEAHHRGQSRDKRQAVLTAVGTAFRAEKDCLGRETIDPEADEVYINRIWALYIEKIVSPNGSLRVAPDESEIKILRGNSPDSELAKVEKAIQELTEGAKSGFESLAQEHDFLSSASPEA